MKIIDDALHLSATDVASHLGCRHLTELERLVAAKKLDRVVWNDPMLEVLQKRGLEHEAAYLDHLRDVEKREILRLEGVGITAEGVEETKGAMRTGAEVIVQATLVDGPWRGRADVLLRVDGESDLGDWSYEVVDTKLASETRAGTVLQLCLYSEMVGTIQGKRPERMYVVSPGKYDAPEAFRLDDFLAYHEQIKRQLVGAVAGEVPTETRVYPEPVAQCDYCSWWSRCDRRRRDDDHLSLVAGVTRLQRRELVPLGYDTLAKLAAAPTPITPSPARGSQESYERVREQARVQLASRSVEVPVWEPLATEAERGLAKLPLPTPGDLFFDFEGDAFIADGGREYLFGWVELDAHGKPHYECRWALTAADERREFESFLDLVTARLEEFPALHIHHFGAYEPGAFKRLMGRYATREEEVDRLLRAGHFVDLHAVVKQSMRVGVEKYSLKDLERLHGFERALDLREASKLLRGVERALEFGETKALPLEACAAVESYNRDDCLSTLSLRNWLETRRTERIAAGEEIERPEPKDGEPSENIEERDERIQALFEKLVDGVPEEPKERSDEQQGRFLLAHLLDWHRRESKASWWELYRLADLAPDDLLEEKAGLGGLEFLKRVGGTAKCPVDRYRFVEQEHGLGIRDPLRSGSEPIGSVEAIDDEAKTIDIKKRADAKDAHPSSIFAHKHVGAKPKPDALERIATWVVEHGIEAPGSSYRAARDLLLRRPPRLRSSTSLIDPSADLKDEVRRLVLDLDHGVLPIQGPPGAGKTYLGARMICALARAGKRVAVTAVSHKVIRNLLDATVRAAEEESLDLRCVQKVTKPDGDAAAVVLEVKSNEELHDELESARALVGGGTAWAWCREEFEELVDVLVVDEAGQMSLADTLAAAPAAKSIVLLGDPQQLEQPIQGSHPEGCAASALEHLLGGHETMPEGAGLFLEETWRLHPSICQFTSKIFYESRLESRPACGRQELIGDTPFAGAGLWWLSCEHRGNQGSSPEEVDLVASTYEGLVDGRVKWRNPNGEIAVLGEDDVLIVAPYNLQVAALSRRLPGARVGTVDKFQGQEAPIVIYSMTTSSPEDAPRGMEFLYSLNRLNVATSRARCAVILIASPGLFAPECRNPRQMRLANAVCGYRELATDGTRTTTR